MSLAQHLRKMAQHDDWRPYNCKVTNAVLTAFLAAGDRHIINGDDHLRTYMLVVAEALDGGTDGVEADPRCEGCDIPNGCPEYCRCTPGVKGFGDGQ
jgi:hypothetical protein